MTVGALGPPCQRGKAREGTNHEVCHRPCLATPKICRLQRGDASLRKHCKALLSEDGHPKGTTGGGLGKGFEPNQVENWKKEKQRQRSAEESDER